MKNIYKKTLSILGGLLLLGGLVSCDGGYAELPPKTDQAIQYALPDPVYPEADEIAQLKALRKEHQDATE